MWFFFIKKKKGNSCFGHSNDFVFSLRVVYLQTDYLKSGKVFHDETLILDLTLLEGS